MNHRSWRSEFISIFALLVSKIEGDIINSNSSYFCCRRFVLIALGSNNTQNGMK